MAEIFLPPFAKVILKVALLRRAFMKRLCLLGSTNISLPGHKYLMKFSLSFGRKGSPNSDPRGRYGHTSLAIFKQESRN